MLACAQRRKLSFHSGVFFHHDHKFPVKIFSLFGQNAGLFCKFKIFLSALKESVGCVVSRTVTPIVGNVEWLVSLWRRRVSKVSIVVGVINSGGYVFAFSYSSVRFCAARFPPNMASNANEVSTLFSVFIIFSVKITETKVRNR